MCIVPFYHSLLLSARVLSCLFCVFGAPCFEMVPVRCPHVDNLHAHVFDVCMFTSMFHYFCMHDLFYAVAPSSLPRVSALEPTPILVRFVQLSFLLCMISRLVDFWVTVAWLLTSTAKIRHALMFVQYLIYMLSKHFFCPFVRPRYYDFF